MNSSLRTRLITAGVALPILLAIILLLPFCNYLAMICVLIFANTVGTWELRNNLVSKRIKLSWTSYLGILLPFVEWINLVYIHEEHLLLMAFVSCVAISAMVELKEGEKDNFATSLERISATTFCIAYPGLFMSYTTRLCFFRQPPAMTILFLSFVFGSDSFAYFTGMLFGKNNKGFVKASPNKSIAGFIGGTVLIGVLAMVAKAILPGFFVCSYPEIFLFATAVAVFGTIGDLFESLLKRSCGVKDSGTIVPGRGGMLDCIDSISFAAPIFVVFAARLFH